LLGQDDGNTNGWQFQPYLATSDDDPELRISNELIDAGASETALKTLLRAAVDRGDVLLALQLNARHIRLADNVDTATELLTSAARAGNAAGVRKIVQAGPELSHPDSHGNFALPEALGSGREDIAIMLLDASVNKKPAWP
jgi:hypothetical protein